MQKIKAHIYTGKSLTVSIEDNGRVRAKTIESSHPNWKEVERRYKLQQYDKMLELFDIAETITRKSGGKITIRGGKIYWGDEEVHGYLIDKILKFIREGVPYKRLLKFAENLYQNPSKASREQLYGFLENGGFPLTDDGCFLGYRGVQADWYSVYKGNIKVIKGKVNDKGQIYNGVGEEIIVDRKEVDANPGQSCGRGLHVGTYDYAKGHSQGHVIVVKVNPRDAVAVPATEKTKLRVCAYKVDSEYDTATKPLNETKGRGQITAAKQGRLPNGRFAKKN